MAKHRSSLVLVVATVGWALFGSWALWADRVLGHTVAFFFFSLCFLALAVRTVGSKRGLIPSVALLAAVAVASEYLQPRFVARPAERADVVSDLVGVGVAVVLVGIAAVIFRDRSRLWVALGGFCLAALAGALALAGAGSESVEARFQCWGDGLEPITASEGSPIVDFDGELVRIGDSAALPIGDGLVSEDSADLRCSVLRSGSYSIVATVVPESIESGGPTRIFTSSLSTWFSEENTHIGQEFDALSIRIRSGKSFQWELVPGVFADGERVTVAVVVSDGRAEAFVDGESRATFELEGAGFAEWAGTFPILIGDEFTRDRTFEGSIESVSFFDRALGNGEPALSGDRG